MEPEDFDVQRRNAFTPEGQIESVGRWARNVGGARLRRWVGIALVTWIVVGGVLLLV